MPHTRPPHIRDTARACLSLTLAVTALVGSTAPADAAGRSMLGIPAPARAHAKLSIADSRRTLDVKFAEGTDVRLRGKRLVSQGAGHIAALDRALAHFPGLRFERVFASAPESELAASRRTARARTGREQADLNLYFRIRTERDTDTAALLDVLNALDIVDVAAPAPKPVAAPASPSYVALQGYRTAAATGGVDADFAQTLAGGKGENVGIVDVEYSWNRSHEDLANARVTGSELANGTPCDPFAAKANATDHGTAVLGELTGEPNGFGVTGLAPGASIRTVNAASQNAAGQCELNLANAIYVAADHSSPGDVILIEQQTAGPNVVNDPNSQFGLVPVEWEQTGGVFAAIRNATSRGRIVVEAAGNGSQNLDDPVYQDSTGKNWFSYDSGAILVGAGNAPGCSYGADPTVARGRLSFSNHGSRLNLQGWGDCVATTGYGALQGGPGSSLAYTSTFGGTSSASPIVAGSAALLSSVAESRGTTLTPAAVRSTLAATGQPQAFANANPGAIGPLPNVKAAIGAIGPKLAESAHVVSGTNLGAAAVPVRESWTSSGSAAAQYEVRLSTDGGTFVKQALASPSSPSAVFSLAPGHDYQFSARAADAAGVWGDWTDGSRFGLGEYQENYSLTNPAFAGTWTRAAWQPAAGGYLSVSGTAGNRATFSFTGSNIAWIATKASNRGQARVYVDGSLVKTVDLFSSTTSAQSIAYSQAWPQSGGHTITVEVVGTTGRPAVDVDAFVRLR